MIIYMLGGVKVIVEYLVTFAAVGPKQLEPKIARFFDCAHEDATCGLPLRAGKIGNNVHEISQLALQCLQNCYP